jgi:predicted transcriptional regulator
MDMARKDMVDKLSIYIPQKRLEEKPVERLMKLGKRRDRSVNYLVVEAILQYVAREENEN